MTISEIAKQVVETQAAHLIRYRKDSAQQGVPQYDCKPYCGRKGGWVLLDTFSASALHAVYEALSPQSREKFNRAPVPKLVAFAFAHVR